MLKGTCGCVRLSLSKTFQTCEPLHDKLDAATLVGDIMGTLQGIVQGNHVYSANESTISCAQSCLVSLRSSALVCSLLVCSLSWLLLRLASLPLCCRIMCGLIEEADSALGALLPLASGLKNQTGRTGGPCRDVSYTSQVTQLKNATWGDNMARQWTWQTCNEFGFFQSAGGVESPFNLLKDVLDENCGPPPTPSVPLRAPPHSRPLAERCPLPLPPCTDYLQMCADVYGEAGGGNLKGGNWTVPVAKTNGHYGARALGGSRIVVSPPAPRCKGTVPTSPTDRTQHERGVAVVCSWSTQVPDGSIDPWHSLALTQPSPIQLALNITPVLIDGTTHCGDMYYPRTEDGPSLVGAREAATVPPPPIDAVPAAAPPPPIGTVPAAASSARSRQTSFFD